MAAQEPGDSEGQQTSDCEPEEVQQERLLGIRICNSLWHPYGNVGAIGAGIAAQNGERIKPLHAVETCHFLGSAMLHLKKLEKWFGGNIPANPPFRIGEVRQDCPVPVEN